ncbi:MAG: nucleotidyltransferase family protein [Candidatus Omnitrophica bacterium]|nr:nucleotidyltransferase family protein [Candidatus Omnitrophota bacterium]
MQALILAAGYGRRLYPLTKEYPKPLLKIKDKPIIDYIIPKLIRVENIKKIWIITNNKFFSYFLKWKEERRFNKPICLINDLSSDYSNRKGALKDIDFAIKQKKIKDDLIVIGGDNLFDEGLDGFISYIKKKKDHFVIGLYRLKDKAKAHCYGVAKVNRQKRIIDFKEKPSCPISNLVAMCLYYFPKEKFIFLDEYLKKESHLSDATGNFIAWLYKREKVYAYTFGGLWYDIGEHEFLREANEKMGV